MTNEAPRLASLAEELSNLRASVRSLRRRVEDILYNLEEENMPTVAERIASLSAGLSLLLTADAEPSINAKALVAALNASTASLSIDRATAPTLYKNAVTRTNAMRLLAVDNNGTLVETLAQIEKEL